MKKLEEIVRKLRGEDYKLLKEEEQERQVDWLVRISITLAVIMVIAFVCMFVGMAIGHVEATIPPTEEITDNDDGCEEVERNMVVVDVRRLRQKIQIQVVRKESQEKTEAEQQRLSYTQETVEMLGDVMYKEFGEVLEKLPESDAEHYLKLTGSVVIHRLNANWQGATTISEVIFSSGYANATKNAVGKGWLGTPEIVYQWAEELLRDGPIGPANLIYQSQSQQGIPYDEIYGEYFGLEPSIKE